MDTKGAPTVRGCIQLPVKYAMGFFQDFEEVDTGECELHLWAEVSAYNYMGVLHASPLAKLFEKTAALDEVLLHQVPGIQNTLNYNIQVPGMDFKEESILVMIKVPVDQVRWELFGGSCDFHMFMNYPKGIGLKAYVDTVHMDWVENVYWVTSVWAGRVWVVESFLGDDEVAGSVSTVPANIHWTSEVDYAHQNNMYRFGEMVPASANGLAMAWIKRSVALCGYGKDVQGIVSSREGALEALCQKMNAAGRTTAFG